MAQRSVEYNHKQDVVTMLCGDYRHMSYRDTRQALLMVLCVKSLLFMIMKAAQSLYLKSVLLALHDGHTTLCDVSSGARKRPFPPIDETSRYGLTRINTQI